MRPISLIGAILIGLAGLAEAGDLMVLKRAVERDDRRAVERWLAEEGQAKDTDPLAALHGRPVPQELSQKASALAADDLMTTALAISFTSSTDPGIKRQLLARIDTALAARQAVARDVERVSKTPLPRPITFVQLFTAGAGEGTKLADPSTSFPPDEKIVYLRFVYEGAVPGEELRSRWLFLSPTGPQEIGQSAMTLKNATDLGQFSFSPTPGTRWAEGIYRIQVLARNSTLREVDFLVERPRLATAPLRPPAVTAPAPAPQQSPAVAMLSPSATTTTPPSGGAVSVLDALFAKDIQGVEAKDPTTEFTTARKRLLLWTRVQTTGSGGALTARWYTTEGGERLLGEHLLALPPGESRVAYWLEVASDKIKFPRGRMRVDLVASDQVVKSLPFVVRQGSFFEELTEAVEQFGKDLDKLLKEGIK
jgi:hypothetical protein